MSPDRKRILLVGVDGIGLSDLKKYQLKNFQSALQNGSSGKLNDCAALPEAISWAGLATGCSPDRHGISGPATIDRETGLVRAAGPCDWHREPIWELLHQQDLLTHRFNLPVRHPEAEQDGCLSVSSLFFNQIKSGHLSPLRSVQPANYFDAVKSLAIAPAQVDEATLKLFIPNIGNQDTAQVPTIGKIAGCIASNLSIQAIAGQAMAELDWDLFMIRFSLADEINRILNTSDNSSGLLTQVHEAACRTLNLCLGSFRRLAGEHTLVLCSMKGEGGGFIAFEGSGIRTGDQLVGPRPKDIAPTLLSLLGFAAPDRMNGRVLEEMFNTAPQTNPCPAVPDAGKPAAPTSTESGWLLEASDLHAASWRVERMANQ